MEAISAGKLGVFEWAQCSSHACLHACLYGMAATAKEVWVPTTHDGSGDSTSECSRMHMSSAQREANIDGDGPDNVVPMHKTVEKKFDHMRFCIIPEPADIFRVSHDYVPGCGVGPIIPGCAERKYAAPCAPSTCPHKP